jgi:chromosomal replication initiation ATPase DnaA
MCVKVTSKICKRSKLLILITRAMINQTIHRNAIQERIITAVCEHYNVTEEQLQASTSFDVMHMRWIVYYLTQKNTFLSTREMGARFSQHRKAVTNGIENIESRKGIYAQTRRSLEEIAKKAGISDF